MLLNLHFFVVLSHRFFSNTKTLKIPSNVDYYAIDASMVLNNNYQELRETNDNQLHDGKMPLNHKKFISHLEVKMITQPLRQ